MKSALYDQWFAIADSDGDGRITGAHAVQFFGRSGLPREVLARVWELSDSTRQGYLDRNAFQRSMDLISLAQQGVEVTKENYATASSQNIPPPKLTGLEDTAPPPSSNPYLDPNLMGGATSPTGVTSPMYPSLDQLNLNGSQTSTPKFSSSKSKKKPISGKLCTSIIDGLKQIYFSKVLPLEDQFKFGSFFSPLLHESDFEAKPSVLLLGQYSTGKTTFIKFLLGRDYPGCHIGPEPTTDRFVVVMHGMEDRRVPGNTLAVQPDKPYQGLSVFGTGFLSRFEGSQCNAKLLEEISLVDTPGVLSGEKQRIERNYNFIDICEWFAGRCDLILLLFDPYKLDISDEFKNVINALRGHDDKVRVVLNKADQVDQSQLMRVYGALMWSLGKVFKSPEVCKVYIGSFNSEAPIQEDKNPYGKALFLSEQENLLKDLYEIPARSCDRKINEFVKRVRAFKIHLLLIGHLRAKMPAVFGKDSAQRKMLDTLPEHFRQVQREHHLPVGDFPNVDRFREILSAFDFNKFPKVSKSMVKQIDDVLSVDIPNLVKAFDNPYQ